MVGVGPCHTHLTPLGIQTPPDCNLQAEHPRALSHPHLHHEHPRHLLILISRLRTPRHPQILTFIMTPRNPLIPTSLLSTPEYPQGAPAEETRQETRH